MPDFSGAIRFFALRPSADYLEGGNVYWATPILQEVAEGDLGATFLCYLLMAMAHLPRSYEPYGGLVFG
jgi:hypothetical protein